MFNLIVAERYRSLPGEGCRAPPPSSGCSRRRARAGAAPEGFTSLDGQFSADDNSEKLPLR